MTCFHGNGEPTRVLDEETFFGTKHNETSVKRNAVPTAFMQVACSAAALCEAVLLHGVSQPSSCRVIERRHSLLHEK